ncbi:MAG: protein translocase subunit SecF [Spirochaetes bacterium]|nr:MAG: protein translocase subunit SecF [Spirochaetota bacterium]
MKRVIRFTRFRYIMPIISFLVIAVSITGTVFQGGFNLGIDFQSGLSMHIQVAPEAFSVTYIGEGQATLNISENALTIEVDKPGEEKERYQILIEQNPTIGDLRAELTKIPGIDVAIHVPESTATKRLLALDFPLNLGEEPAVCNLRLTDRNEIFASIEEVRDALEAVGGVQIQMAGEPINQEFLIRVEDREGERDFTQSVSSEVLKYLENRFGENRVIVRQTDYVGPRFSETLVRQSVYLISFAMALILLYIWFRFKLPYAVSAIVALIHDVSVMVGFIGVFQLEISTATIAALLTIIGYSLNDTIVIFDRIRENNAILRDSPFRDIIDTSITQSLSRTLMTSFTTLLAVLAIYFFAIGTIKLFALNLIVGVFVGTYSSMFIASPILLGWISSRERLRKDKERKKYGIKKEESALQKVEANSSVSAENITARKEEKDKVIVPAQKERKPRGKKRKKKKK